MKSSGNNRKLVDFVFWIVFIFFTNPGGILMAMGEDSGDGGINVQDILFAVLCVCYLFVYYNRHRNVGSNYQKILFFLILFFAYHFIVFSFMTPIFREKANYPIKFILIKNRHELISLILFVLVFEFYLRSYKLFFKLLLYSTLIVITLFLISVVTGLDILPVLKGNRGFINIDRIFLTHYGLMPLLIPMGAVLIAFKIKEKWRNLVLIGFTLMFLTWLLSLTRRHIFGTLIFVFVAFVLNNYFLNKPLLPYNRIFTVVFYFGLIVFFLNFTFPEYINAGVKTIEETVYVLKHGETTTGKKDLRLGMGKKIMQDLVKENLVFGTGFDNRWRTSEGDKAGFEAADYPFIAAIAMKGLIGLLFFLPVYIILIKSLIFNFKYIKNKKPNFNNIEFFMLILFILFFVNNLMQYMNLFSPVSLTKQNQWFVILAMYLASMQVFYEKEKLKELIIRKIK